MRMKCQNCKKWFNNAFYEEYCPYCGTVLEENVRNKIKNKEYFWNAYWWLLLVLPATILLIIGLFVS